MVDSTPTGAGPPSTMKSMRPPRSSITCCAVVGETWPERLADGATTGRPSRSQNAERDRMLRHPHGDAVEARGRKLGHRAAGALLQHQGQRPRPERRGELFGRGVEHREALGRGEIEHMRDQRIERRPALGGIEPRDGGAVGGVGAEAIDGLGRKRDQAAVGEADAPRRRWRRNRPEPAACRSCRSFLLSSSRGALGSRRARPSACRIFFAASTLIQSRLRSSSMFCSRSNSRAIAVRSQWRVSSRNFSRISARSSGCSGVPLKLSTRRVSARPSLSVTVTVEAMLWPCLASSATEIVTRWASARIAGSLNDLGVERGRIARVAVMRQRHAERQRILRHHQVGRRGDVVDRRHLLVAGDVDRGDVGRRHSRARAADPRSPAPRCAR